MQSSDERDYITLERDDSKLYHVATDSYILSFLPMAGEVVPQLDIVPKDETGKPIPIDDFDELIVYENDRQLKVWKTVVEYAASQQPDEDGIPLISNYYNTELGRINPIKTVPLIVWQILGFMIIGTIITLVCRRRYRKRKGISVLKF